MEGNGRFRGAEVSRELGNAAAGGAGGHILELAGVRKTLGSFTLQDLSFALPRGFVMGFIGRNGAGKTTTIKLILNMLRRDSGVIRVLGRDMGAAEAGDAEEAEERLKARIGVVLDTPFYAEEWTLRDVERACAPFYRRWGVWDADAYRGLLEKFALDPRKKVKELSRGMKVRLMLACALSHHADLLILDEPTSGLDPVARDELLDILRDFMAGDAAPGNGVGGVGGSRDAGESRRGILFSTHITQDLERIADYITFIHEGKLLYTGTREALLDRYVLVKGGRESLAAAGPGAFIGCREYGEGFEALAERGAAAALPGAAALVTEPATLEDIIIRFTKRNGEGAEEE